MSKYPDYKYINVKIIAKSRNLKGEDVVTYELEYPRYLHSEIMTHRVFGRNAQSCLHGDSEIYFDLPSAINKGKRQKYGIKLSELYRKWNTPYLQERIANMKIRCLNEDTKEIVNTSIKEVVYSGQKDVYEIETEKGYILKCSADHRIFTDKGWQTLKDMRLREVPGGMAIQKDIYLACNGEEAYKNPDWLISQRNSGKTLVQIARENNWNEKSVRYYAEKNKIKFAKTLDILDENLQYKDREWLLSAREKGLTCGRIAVLCNTTEDRVKKACKKHKIEVPVGVILSNGGRRRSWNTGLTYEVSEEAKIRLKLNARKGPLIHNWKGGPEMYSDRNAAITRFLNVIRQEKMQEAGWKCAVSGENKKLELHHVDPTWNNPTRSLDETNIIVLSRKVHRYIHANNLEFEFKRYVEEGLDLTKFMEQINFKINHKEIGKSFYKGNKLACRFDKIKSVKYVGKVDVYDIEVVGPYHNFIADGVVVHNSRAVPITKTLEVNADWVKPITWSKNKAGMSATEELSGEVLAEVQSIWNNTAETVLEASKQLSELGLHKQYANRITEPFSRIKVIITATEWDNFFWLRDDEDAAQPEIVELAQRMKEVNENTPTVQLDIGMWHLPYVFQEFTARGKQIFLDTNANELDVKTALKISASCCGQVSYRKLDDSIEKALQIYEKLFSGPKPHMSPTEHQAKVPPKYADFRTTGITHMDRIGNAWSGNLKNFVQYRQLIQTS